MLAGCAVTAVDRGVRAAMEKYASGAVPSSAARSIRRVDRDLGDTQPVIVRPWRTTPIASRQATAGCTWDWKVLLTLATAGARSQSCNVASD